MDIEDCSKDLIPNISNLQLSFVEKMKEQGEISFTSAMTLALECGENIPERYVQPLLQRPNPTLMDHPSTSLPVVDLSSLNDPLHRSQAIDEIRAACNKLGFFQV